MSASAVAACPMLTGKFMGIELIALNGQASLAPAACHCPCTCHDLAWAVLEHRPYTAMPRDALTGIWRIDDVAEDSSGATRLGLFLHTLHAEILHKAVPRDGYQ